MDLNKLIDSIIRSFGNEKYIKNIVRNFAVESNFIDLKPLLEKEKSQGRGFIAASDYYGISINTLVVHLIKCGIPPIVSNTASIDAKRKYVFVIIYSIYFEFVKVYIYTFLTVVH